MSLAASCAAKPSTQKNLRGVVSKEVPTLGLINKLTNGIEPSYVKIRLNMINVSG